MKTVEEMQARIDRTPFAHWLGLVVESSDENGVVIRMPSRLDLQGSPSTKALHGGVTAALIDTGGSYAVMASTGRSIVTIDMRVDYHRAAISTEYRVKGTIVRLGKTLATADSHLYDVEGTLIASGRVAVMHVDR